MAYRIRETGEYVATFSALKSKFPGSLRVVENKVTAAMLDDLGVDSVLQGPQATGGTVYQYSQFNGVEQVGDQWFTKYILGPIFTDTTDEDGVTTTAAEHQAEYETRKDEEQAASVRETRNQKLRDCDWTQISDSTADKETWATYRQALRDVTAQDGFPWTIDWPVAP
jgi:hypothetical protein